MSRAAKSLKNKRFSAVTVLSFLGRNEHNNSKWLCRCDCGKEFEVWYQNLTSKRTRSCGCGIKPPGEIDDFWG